MLSVLLSLYWVWTLEPWIQFIFLLHFQGSLGSVNFFSALHLHIHFSNTLAIPEKKLVWALYFLVFHTWVLYFHYFHPLFSSLQLLPYPPSQVHDLSYNYYCYVCICINSIYTYISHTYICIYNLPSLLSVICMHACLGLTTWHGRTYQGACLQRRLIPLSQQPLGTCHSSSKGQWCLWSFL